MVLVALPLPAPLREPNAGVRLFRDLAEAGISSFVWPGDPSEEMRLIAEEMAIPLICPMASDSPVSVEKAVIGLLLDRQAQLQRRQVEIYRELAQLAIEDQGLPAILKRLADLVDRLVVAQDEYGHVQDFARSRIGLAEGPASPEEVAELIGTAAPAELQSPLGASASTSPPVVCQKLGGGMARFIAPIAIKGTIAGFLSIVGRESELHEIDELATGRAASVCAIEMAKQRAVMDARIRLEGDFLEDLLLGNVSSEEAMLARARHLGFDLTAPHLAFVVGLDQGSARSRMGPEGSMVPRPRLFEVLRSELAIFHKGAALLDRADEVSVLLPISTHGSLRETLSRLAQLRTVVKGSMGDQDISLGAGRSHPGVSGIARSHWEARQAMAIGQRFLGGNRLFFFGELGIFRLLSHLSDAEEFAAFYQELVGPLEEYDSTHGTEFIKTLEGFFSCNGNQIRAAQGLHLHRNTLLYRLERIQDITGLQLEDPDTRLSLQVALKIKDIVSRLRRRDENQGEKMGVLSRSGDGATLPATPWRKADAPPVAPLARARRLAKVRTAVQSVPARDHSSDNVKTTF